MKQLGALSYSRLKTYETCPRRASWEYLERRPFTRGRALKRGTMIHELAEQYVRGDCVELPRELWSFRAQFDQLRAAYDEDRVIVEGEYAFDRDWKPCAWDDYDIVSWRAKLDVLIRSDDVARIVIDHKTGQVRIDEDQLALYALMVFLRDPGAETVEAELWFLDYGDLHGPWEYTRAQMDSVKEQLEQRMQRAREDKRFDPTPGGHCGWCPFKDECDARA